MPASVQKRRVAAAKGPSPSEWELKKPLIRSLYCDRDLSLTEVQRILQEEHGFNANIRMYKTRIKQWRFDKKSKEHEMLAIARKDMLRRASDKQSRFQIRGSDVHMGRVEYYFKRRGTTIEDALREAPSPAPSTPSEITCTTPASNDGDGHLTHHSAEDETNIQTIVGLQPTRNDLLHLFLGSPRPSRHLRSPSSLRVSESLLKNLKTYLQAFQASSSTTPLLQPRWEVFVNAWYNTWKTGCCLFRDKKNIEAGNTIQHAMDQINEMMGTHGLVPLMCIFRLIPSLRYYQEYFDAGALEALFLKYLRSLTSFKYPQLHPMAMITLELAQSDQRDDLVIAAMSQIADTFSHTLGEAHSDVLAMRLYIVQQHLVLHRYQAVEVGANKVIATCSGNNMGLEEYTGRALLLLADTLHRHERFADAEIAINDVWRRFTSEPACTPLWKIEALHLLCDALQGQDKWSEAEIKMREAFELSLQKYGPEHAKTSVSLDYLERYLVRQGKLVEAAIISKQLAEITSYHDPSL